ncbi:hypothetical protein CsSME_00049282 [Camellia sinensis var. sinensis]
MATSYVCLWIRSMCCQDFQISQKSRTAYYACLNPVPCLSWIGWCDEPRRLNTESNSAMHDIVNNCRIMSLTCNKRYVS